MISDALVSFIPIGAPLSLVGGAGITFRSGIIDLIGEGVGVNPISGGNDIIGVGRATFGTDMGVGGRLRPELNVVVGVGLTGAVGTTLKVALQGAPDVASNPGPWVDIDSQDNIGLANVAGGAGAVAGAVIFRTPFIPTMPPGLMPRFLSLLFSPQTTAGLITTTPGGNFTAGTILSATVTWIRDDQANKFANRNYSVA
jgi:hypothetical protein